jgi:hypothetical protein
VPYTFYAAQGHVTINNRFRPSTRKKTTAAILAVYAIVAVLYMASPTTSPVSTYAVL